jgi:transcriptional regulator with XRE-family HTH domain
VLTDKQRQKVISKLSSQMSDNEIAEKCGVSRSTVWRIRQDEAEKLAKLKRAEARTKAREKKRIQATDVKPPKPEAPPQKPAAVAQPPESPAIAPVIPIFPKVDAEPVTMANYFAVQILRGESVKDVAYDLMKAAEGAGELFRKLQILDCISVGTTAFARFRSDLGDVASVLSASGRGFIAFSDGCYRATFTDGRQVKYPTTVMCSVQKSGFGQSYAGPKIIRWAQQFPRGN